MASIEQTPEDRRTDERQLIARRNRQGIGIDIGWRTLGLDIWWGNTRDVVTLRAVIQDARNRKYEFALAPETEALLGGKA